MTEAPGPPPPGRPRRVAIACQGGGSHTAFTAGVLSRLFDGPERSGGLDGYEVVGLSGTSGGAVCALMAWTALRDGDQRKARACSTGSGATTSRARRWTRPSTLAAVDEHPAETGFLPTVSPSDLPSTGLDHFRDLLTRRVDLDRIEADPLGAQPHLRSVPSTSSPGSSAPSTASRSGSSRT